MSTEFTEGVTAPQGEPQEEVGSQTERYLDQFVGEGKKYSSVEEAAEALAKKAVNADKHIQTLIDETTQAKEKLAHQKTIEDVLAAIREEQTIVAPQVVNETPATTGQAPDVNKAVEEAMKDWKAAEQKKNAVTKAWESLASPQVFGDITKAKAAVAQYIKDNPSRQALVDQMAIADPQGLVRILKPDAQGVVFTEPAQGSNTGNQPSSGALTWDEAWKVKKENPKLYRSAAFRKRMQEELN